MAGDPTTIAEGLVDAYGIIEDAIHEHGHIERTFLLLSGGNDSMVLLDTCLAYADDVVHINTGTGIPETTEFVRQVCADRDVPLTELHPPITYEELVLGRWQGFPGPGAHRFAYTMLKERCVEQLLRAHRTKRGERFVLLTGARTDESERRMGNAEPHRREGGQVWVNPLNNWSNDLMRLYRGVYNLPENEVTKHLHMSGECLCGAFAKPGEKDHVGFFYPAWVEWIEGIEEKARAAGLKRCKWGERPPRIVRVRDEWCAACGRDAGTDIDEHVENGGTIDHQYRPAFGPDHGKRVPAEDSPGPMCSDCTLWDEVTA